MFRSAKVQQASESAKRRAIIENINAERLDISNKLESNY